MPPPQIRLVVVFRSVTTMARNGKHKTVVLFAAEADGPLHITPHDHEDYAWVPWQPPHDFSPWPRIHRALLDWEEHLKKPAQHRVQRAVQHRRKAS